MKKTLLLLAFMLCAAPLFAQDNTLPSTKSNAWIDRPDVVIKGEELKNFPSANLKEMLIGRLPGLDLTPGIDTKFLFVVDGMLRRDINFININDVEEIAYYRGGLNGKFGIYNSFTNIILITTKSAAFNQSLQVDVNTQFGIEFIKDNPDKKHINPQSYHVALSQGSDKFSWRTSATYSKHFSDLGVFDRDNLFRLNGDLRFVPLNWISIGAGLNYASDNSKLTTNELEYERSFKKASYKKGFDNWNGFFALNIQPIKGLVNEFKILKDNSKLNNELYQYNDYFSPAYTGTNTFDKSLVNKVNDFSFMNDLNYTFLADQDKIKLKLSAIYRDSRIKYNKSREEERKVLSSGVLQPRSGMWIQAEYTDKKRSLTGQASLDLYNILFVEGGITRDNIQANEVAWGDKRSYKSPFFSARINLKDVVFKEVGFVNEFNLFGSYSKYRSPIPVKEKELSMGYGIGIPVFDPPSFDDKRDKMKTQNYGVSGSFFNDRLHLSGDWLKTNTQELVKLNFASTEYPAILFTAEKTGWRIWSSAEILRDKPFKWNFGASIYRNKNKLIGRDEFRKGNVPTSNEGLNYGMQQQFYYSNFSLNINGYAYFNNPEYILKPDSKDYEVALIKSSYYNINYTSIGYNFKGKQIPGGIKDLTVNIFGRNLFQQKQDVSFSDFYRTVGLGISAKL